MATRIRLDIALFTSILFASDAGANCHLLCESLNETSKTKCEIWWFDPKIESEQLPPIVVIHNLTKDLSATDKLKHTQIVNCYHADLGVTDFEFRPKSGGKTRLCSIRPYAPGSLECIDVKKSGMDRTKAKLKRIIPR